MQVSPVFEKIFGANPSLRNVEIEQLISYSLYKIAKRKFCSDFKEREKRDPSENEKLDFAHSMCEGDMLDRFTAQAEDFLIGYATSWIDSETPHIINDSVAKRVEEIKHIIPVELEKQKNAFIAETTRTNNFTRQLLLGTLSSILVTFLMIILVTAIYIFGIDLIDGLESIINGIESRSKP